MFFRLYPQFFHYSSTPEVPSPMTFPPVDLILIFLWGGFFAYWWLSALRNRTPSSGRQPGSASSPVWVSRPVLSCSLPGWLLPGSMHPASLPDVLSIVISGLLVVILGICFAVWARVHLGSKLEQPSRYPREPYDHPYRPVCCRTAPIYTGILTGCSGLRSRPVPCWFFRPARYLCAVPDQDPHGGAVPVRKSSGLNMSGTGSK